MICLQLNLPTSARSSVYRRCEQFTYQQMIIPPHTSRLPTCGLSVYDLLPNQHKYVPAILAISLMTLQ